MPSAKHQFTKPKRGVSASAHRYHKPSSMKGGNGHAAKLAVPVTMGGAAAALSDMSSPSVSIYVMYAFMVVVLLVIIYLLCQVLRASGSNSNSNTSQISLFT
jgi:hypothetical protein